MPQLRSATMTRRWRFPTSWPARCLTVTRRPHAASTPPGGRRSCGASRRRENGRSQRRRDSSSRSCASCTRSSPSNLEGGVRPPPRRHGSRRSRPPRAVGAAVSRRPSRWAGRPQGYGSRRRHSASFRAARASSRVRGERRGAGTERPGWGEATTGPQTRPPKESATRLARQTPSLTRNALRLACA